MKNILMAMLCGVALAGCFDGDNSQDEGEAGIDVSTLTPKAAVETWWAIKDELIKDEYIACLEERGLGRFDYLKERVAADDLLSSLTQKSCVSSQYERTVERIDEDEKNAVVHVLIKNITPPGKGVTLSYAELEAKVAGGKFRYLLKNEGVENPSWRITQIYSYFPRSDSWYPEYRAPEAETNHFVDHREQ